MQIKFGSASCSIRYEHHNLQFQEAECFHKVRFKDNMIIAELKRIQSIIINVKIPRPKNGEKYLESPK